MGICLEMSDSPGKRLKAFRNSVGMSQRDFALACGVSGGLIGQLEADIQPPSRTFLQKISTRYGVSADWLLHGTGAMQQAISSGFDGNSGKIEPADPTKPLSADFRFGDVEFSVVRRMDLSVSAGNGLIAVESSASAGMAFSRSWLLNHKISADLAVIVQVKGDSMAPTIQDRALILVDCGDKDISRKGIFAFNRGEESYVKRLAPAAPAGAKRPDLVTIISDNPSYPPDALVGDQIAELRIVGRVKCVFTDV